MRVIFLLCVALLAGCKINQESKGGQKSEGGDEFFPSISVQSQHKQADKSTDQSVSAGPVLMPAPLSPEQEQAVSGLIGKKIDVLIGRLGVPEKVASASSSGTIFTWKKDPAHPDLEKRSDPPSVVFVYVRTGLRVYVSRDCTVLDIEALREVK
jgi:hypothetical protein